MVIKRLHIDGFGRLSNHTLDLDPAFTVIYGQNENGKSTLMSFIRLMFYGFSGKTQDVSKNLRQKFRPWSGAPMRGHILFEHEGTLYRLERSFGATQSKDTVKVMNETTGSPVPIASSQEPGVHFFGLDEEAFCKSVFIGQGASVIEASAKKDQITERLLQSVTTGGEEIPYQTALGAIRSAKEALVSKTGKNGDLVRLRERYLGLQKDKSQSMADEQAKKEEQEAIAQLGEQTRALARMRQAVREEIECRGILQQQKQAEESLARMRRILDLRAEQTSLRQELMSAQGVLTGAFLDEMEEILRRVEEYRKEEIRLGQTESQAIRALETLSEQTPQEVPLDLLDQLKDQEAQAQMLTGQIRQLQEASSVREELLGKKQQFAADEAEFQDLARALTKAGEALGRLQEEIRTHRQEREALHREAEALTEEKQALQITLAGDEREMRLDTNAQGQVPQPGDEEGARRRRHFRSLAAAAVLIALGIVAHPVFYAGLVLVLIDLWRAGRLTHKPKEGAKVQGGSQAAGERETTRRELERRLTDSRRRLQAAEETLQRVQTRRQALEATLQTAEPALEKQKLEHTRLLILHESAGRSLERLREEIDRLGEAGAQEADLKDQISTKQEKLAAIERATHEILAACGAADRQGMLEKRYGYQSWQNQAAGLKRQAQDARSALERTKDLRRAQEEEALCRIASWQPAATLEEVKIHLPLLRDKTERLAALSIKADFAAQSGEVLGKGAGAEELEEKIRQCRATLSSIGWDGPTGEEDALLREQESRLTDRFAELEKQAAAREAEVREKYRTRPNISQTEEKLEQIRLSLKDKEQEYAALSKAEETLQAAFEELQQSFGPKLNDRTGRILSRLTGGKYAGVRIDRHFGISVEEQAGESIRESGYLSGGTVDQAYLALRLAVCDLIAQDALPLFLDDVFTQYDDERAREGLGFLAEYRKDKGIQTVLFTCHSRISDWAGAMGGIKVQMIG